MGRTAAGLVMAAAVFVALPAMAQETAKKGDATAASTAAGAAPAAQPAADEAGAPQAGDAHRRRRFPHRLHVPRHLPGRQGFIMPPFVDVGVSLYNGDGALENVTDQRRLVEQHSLRSERQRQRLDRTQRVVRGGLLRVGRPSRSARWKPGVLFTSYTSPNDAFKTVHELAVVLAFDDSGNTFPLNPKAILAFELDGPGRRRRRGAARAPTSSSASGRWCRSPRTRSIPLTLAIPAKIGSQPQRLLRGRERQRHLRLLRSRRHPQRPSRLHERQDATWDLHGGLDILWLGENMKALNGGDGVKAGGRHRLSA